MVDNYLSWTFPGVGRPLVFMVLQGIVFFLILCIIENDICGLSTTADDVEPSESSHAHRDAC